MAVEQNDAKEFLKQYRLCDIQIRNRLEQRERLESIRQKVTTSWGTERVSGSCNNDKIADTTAKILALEKELDSEVDDLKAKMNEVNGVLGKITNETHLELLSKVYISYESLERTACEMGYTYRNACYIHGDALNDVKAILAERQVNHG